jgi:hypothetical protein
MEGAAGALGVTFCGAVCATGAGCGVSNADGRTAEVAGGFVQPSCSTKFAIICLVSGDHPSSGAFAAKICLAASP